MKKVIDIVLNSFLLVLIIIFAISITSAFMSIFNKDKVVYLMGYKPLVVLTGSMTPSINPGDLIVSKRIKQNDIKVGDIITFRSGNILVTHRVLEVVYKNETFFYKTKGDANNTEDLNLASEDDLLGKTVLTVPYCGYVVNFVSSRVGFVICILLPSLLLLFDQIKTILSELKKKVALDEKDNMEI